VQVGIAARRGRDAGFGGMVNCLGIFGGFDDFFPLRGLGHEQIAQRLGRTPCASTPSLQAAAYLRCPDRGVDLAFSRSMIAFGVLKGAATPFRRTLR